jgi:hypothetical protein
VFFAKKERADARLVVVMCDAALLERGCLRVDMITSR